MCFTILLVIACLKGNVLSLDLKVHTFVVHLMSRERELHNLGTANIKARSPEVLNDLKKSIVKSTAKIIIRRGFE